MMLLLSGRMKMTIARILANRDRPVISCTPNNSVLDVARLLAEHRIGALPVVDNDAVCGIFSERDLAYCVARDGDAALYRAIGEVMTTPPITVTPDTTVLVALSLMTRRRIRHLPVVDQGQMLGFISIGDLVAHRIALIEGEAQAMREYIHSA